MDKQPEQFQLDDQAYIIDPKAEDDTPIFPPDVEEVINRIRAGTITDEEAAQYIPDPGARAWVAATRPIREMRKVYKGLVAEGATQICRNDYCVNVVTPSKNIGVKKVFCSRKCRKLQANRNYQRRRRTGTDWTLVQDQLGRDVRVSRAHPVSEEIAEAMYKIHIGPGSKDEHPCPSAAEESRWRCPAHMYQDYYSKERRCLIYAVLVDDWKGWMAKNRGEFYIRQFTNLDGTWLGMESTDVHYTDSMNTLLHPKGY